MKNNYYNELMVLDIANNHFGDVKHAKKIIDKFSKIIKKYKLNATFKFQFRDLDTFIHKDSKESGEKYVKRFMSTMSGTQRSFSIRSWTNHQTKRSSYAWMILLVTSTVMQVILS